MMRSDSDLDEVESFQETTMDYTADGVDEHDDDDSDETEPTIITDDTAKKTGSKKEWRKLWRTQKTYWKERDNKSNKLDERDETGWKEEEEKEEKEKDSIDDLLGNNDDEDNIRAENEQPSANLTKRESSPLEEANLMDEKPNESSDKKIPLKGWRLLKRLQQRRNSSAPPTKNENDPKVGEDQVLDADEDESAMWRDILFTIGSLTDDEVGESADEDLVLDDIREQLLSETESELETSLEQHDDGEVIPPSPWSSLKRLRNKLKESRTASNEEEEQAESADNDNEAEEDRIDQQASSAGDDAMDNNDNNNREEAPAESSRTWTSLKRLRGRMKETTGVENDESAAVDTGDNSAEDRTTDGLDPNEQGGAIAGNDDEATEAPSAWSSLKRFRNRIKNSEGETSDAPPTAGDEIVGNAEPGGGNNASLEHAGSIDETEYEGSSKRWGVLDRLRKKLDVDNADSIDDQIESLAKELEKEQSSRSTCTPDIVEEIDEGEEKDTKDEVEQENAPRKGWTLFKRMQERLSSERSFDGEPEGYGGIDEEFAIRTIHVLHTRNQELEDLVERLQRANEILKAECKLNTVKVNELTNIIESKHGNVAEDQLVHKSIENAELLMQVNELQMELDKANNSVQSLKVEKEEHKRLISGMGRVLDALHTARVDESSASLPSMGPSGELSIDDLEPKIERIMEDREQLVLRCNELERENDLKDEQIEQLSEALDAQSFRTSAIEKVREDEQSVQSELTKSTYTGASVSSSSLESDDNYNSRLRSLYNSVSSKVMSGGHMEIVEEGLCADNEDASSVNAIQGQNDDLESIKQRLNASDPKYVEFLSLMNDKGMLLQPVPSGEMGERPDERPEQEMTNKDEIICDLVI